ncbi:uncharacterized protein LOC131950050 isoform X3 [Physella acuta]|uniref:uncharacterized protein LOC131950050 isoform X3 n=1 Tax=Physella acuta TaxID=109671 RepID=UPI0027DB1B41|nr:uncharacterized protein LOC131950050 isoform X3 [Physella acuta]
MHLARRILQIVFLGFLCTMVSCHGLISDESIDATSQPDTETTQQYDNNNNYEKASTLEGFIRLLGDDPRQVLSSMYGQNDGGKNIAKPDICSPRPISVKLKYNLDRTGIIHYPVCTLVDRCGGCSTPGVKCVPTKTEWLNLTAIAAEYSNTAIAWTYKEVYVAIRRHLSCKIQCSLNDEKCGPKKIFKAADCLCYCREHLKCVTLFPKCTATPAAASPRHSKLLQARFRHHQPQHRTPHRQHLQQTTHVQITSALRELSNMLTMAVVVLAARKTSYHKIKYKTNITKPLE